MQTSENLFFLEASLHLFDFWYNGYQHYFNLQPECIHLHDTLFSFICYTSPLPWHLLSYQLTAIGFQLSFYKVEKISFAHFRASSCQQLKVIMYITIFPLLLGGSKELLSQGKLFHKFLRVRFTQLPCPKGHLDSSLKCIGCFSAVNLSVQVTPPTRILEIFSNLNDSMVLCFIWIPSLPEWWAYILSWVMSHPASWKCAVQHTLNYTGCGPCSRGLFLHPGCRHSPVDQLGCCSGEGVHLNIRKKNSTSNEVVEDGEMHP